MIKQLILHDTIDIESNIYETHLINTNKYYYIYTICNYIYMLIYIYVLY